ncbi:MAG TPA: hypothetical protein VF887_03555 [Gemmatimonadaceae bacterium]
MRKSFVRASVITGLSMLVLAGIVSAQGTSVQTQESLVGTWEAITRSAGGIGSTLTFGADNSLTFTVGAMLDAKYRRAGDTLFIVDPSGHATASRIKISHDTLVTTTPDNREQRETRVGTALLSDPLVGLWTYPHYTGVAAFEQYTPDGQLHLRVPIRTLKGTYATARDSAMLHLPGPGGGDRGVHFAIVADTLILAWGSQSNRYLKVRPLVF